MAEYLHPGVYVEEVSSGVRPIEGVGTSTAGFVGKTLKGIPNKATFITSWAQFVRKFGYLDSDSYLPYAVSNFFENGGKRCYVVRVLNDASAQTADVSIPDRQNPGVNSLRITALGAGGWGNDLSIRIEDGTDNPTREFKIVVLHEGNVVEVFDNLSMDTAALSYVETEVNSGSEFVRVEDLNSHIVSSRARTQTAAPLAGALTFGANNATITVTVQGGASVAVNLAVDLTPDELVTRLTNDLGPLNISSATLDTGELELTHNAAGFDRYFTVALSGSAAGQALVAGIDGFFRGSGAAVAAELRTTNAGPWDLSGGNSALTLDVEGDVQNLDFTALPVGAPAIAQANDVQVAELAAVLDWVGRNPMNGLVTAREANGDVVLTGGNRGANQSTVTLGGAAAGVLGFAAADGTANTDAGLGASEAAFLLSDAGPFTLEVGNSLTIDVNNGALGVPVSIPVAITPASFPNLQQVTSAQLAAFLAAQSAEIAVTVVNNRVRIAQTRQGNYYTLQLTDGAGSPNIRLNFETSLRTGYVAGDKASPYVRPGFNFDLSGLNQPWELTNGDDGSPVSDFDFIGTADRKSGMHAFDDVDDVNFMAVPGNASAGVINAGVGYCSTRGNVFFIADSPEPANGIITDPPTARSFLLNDITAKTSYGGLYYPWILSSDPIGAGRNPTRYLPPSGFVAGLYARTDTTRGVHKAPAGTEAVVFGALGLEYSVTDAEQDILNPPGVNCLRQFPAAGLVIWGARTLGTQSDPEWRYIPVRRYSIYLRESIYRGTQWAVFEPNDFPLWEALTNNITDFMMGEFRKGALAGRTPAQAFEVKCDADLNPPSEVNAGRVNMELKFAPLRPAEFVIIRISQKIQQPEG